MARSSMVSLSASIRQKRRINRGVIAALEKIPSDDNLAACRSRAPITRRRIAAESSASSGGHINVDVYAIQQRPGNAADVTLNLQRSAATFACGIIPEATGTRIHSGRQHKRSRKSQRHRGATDSYLLIREWLPQDFPDAAIEC